MTNVLEHAIEQAQKLPEVEQDLVGEMVLAYMEGDHRSFRLTAEQVAEVKLAQAEVRKGEVATDTEVAELWDSFIHAGACLAATEKVPLICTAPAAKFLARGVVALPDLSICGDPIREPLVWSGRCSRGPCT